jgi:hypothetical protein
MKTKERLDVDPLLEKTSPHIPDDEINFLFPFRKFNTPGQTRRFQTSQLDDLVKSLKRRISVIPAKAGIQLFQILKNYLDSGFHRSDDFLRDHQLYGAIFWPCSKE